MGKEEAVFATGKAFKDNPAEDANSANKDTSNRARVCPSCGARRKKFLDTCTECGVAFESRKGRDVMVSCPMCNGTGTIFLHYLDEHASLDGNQDDRWLPCSDCDGIGELPRSVIMGRQNRTKNKTLRDFLVAVLLNLLSWRR